MAKFRFIAVDSKLNKLAKPAAGRASRGVSSKGDGSGASIKFSSAENDATCSKSGMAARLKNKRISTGLKKRMHRQTSMLLKRPFKSVLNIITAITFFLKRYYLDNHNSSPRQKCSMKAKHATPPKGALHSSWMAQATLFILEAGTLVYAAVFVAKKICAEFGIHLGTP